MLEFIKGSELRSLWFIKNIKLQWMIMIFVLSLRYIQKKYINHSDLRGIESIIFLRVVNLEVSKRQGCPKIIFGIWGKNFQNKCSLAKIFGKFVNKHKEEFFVVSILFPKNEELFVVSIMFSKNFPLISLNRWANQIVWEADWGRWPSKGVAGQLPFFNFEVSVMLPFWKIKKSSSLKMQ